MVFAKAIAFSHVCAASADVGIDQGAALAVDNKVRIALRSYNDLNLGVAMFHQSIPAIALISAKIGTTLVLVPVTARTTLIAKLAKPLNVPKLFV